VGKRGNGGKGRRVKGGMRVGLEEGRTVKGGGKRGGVKCGKGGGIRGGGKGERLRAGKRGKG
jgi:hypothetical protein